MTHRQRWMIDSIEEGTASIEQGDGKVFHVPLFLLPEGVREGQICGLATDQRAKDEAAVTTITVDKDATRSALERSAAQLASTPKSKDPGGPIQL